MDVGKILQHPDVVDDVDRLGRSVRPGQRSRSYVGQSTLFVVASLLFMLTNIVATNTAVDDRRQQIPDVQTTSQADRAGDTDLDDDIHVVDVLEMEYLDTVISKFEHTLVLYREFLSFTSNPFVSI